MTNSENYYKYLYIVRHINKQNMHLFGIDPNQIEDEEGEGDGEE